MRYGMMRAAAAAGVFVCVMMMAAPARGAFIVNFNQVGSDVVATGSGTINLAALSLGGSGAGIAGVVPVSGVLLMGPTSPTSSTIYNGVSTLSSFGSGGVTTATSGSGDAVGVFGNSGELVVPIGYVSGSALSDTDTYSGQTFASLGLTVGTYVLTWGSGATADSFTVNIGVNTNGNGASVPLPAGVWAGAIGAGMLAVWMRRKAVGSW